MTLLQRVYASAPTGSVIVRTLDIRVTGQDPVFLCDGFNPVTAALETDEVVTFEPGNLVINLPRKDDSGQQSLRFGLWNVTSQAQDIINAALEDGGQVPVIYREYLLDDLGSPAAAPLPFVMVGGEFQGIELHIEASYYDILNTAWPRERYTSLNAPGLLSI